MRKILLSLLSLVLLFISCSKTKISNTQSKYNNSSSLENIILGLENDDQEAYEYLSDCYKKLKKGDAGIQVAALATKMPEETYYKFVIFLCESGCYLGGGNGSMNVMMVAAELGYNDLLEYLFSTPLHEEINMNFSCFGPPLIWAINSNHYDTAELLLQHGADPTINLAGYSNIKDFIQEIADMGIISSPEKWFELLNQYTQ